MIAKRVARDKATSDFGRLARYVLDAKRNGEKVAFSRFTNIEALPEDAVAVVLATQAKNTRARGDKSYHLVVSFPDGERPSTEQLTDIEDSLAAAIGLADHQRLSAVHTDTAHLHLHIAINKVHPTTFRCVEPYYDKRRLQAVCRELEQRHGLEPLLTRRGPGAALPSAAGGRPADLEAHRGEESFRRWAAAEVVPAVLAVLREGSPTWEDVHAAAARFGVELKPRGAGLTLAARGGGAALKPSTLSRELSLKALVTRLGPYQPAAGAEPHRLASSAAYRPRPLQRSPASARLYDEYLRWRNASLASRREHQAVARAAAAKYRSELAAWHRERRELIRKSASLTRVQKRTLYADLARERRGDWATERARIAAESAAMRARFPLPAWIDFLRERVDAGDEVALAVLRETASRDAARKAGANLLTVQGAPNHVARPLLGVTSSTRKDGAIVYAVADGGRIRDGAEGVFVERRSRGALVMALSVAAARFGERALEVRGTAAFRRGIATLAGDRAVPVTFEDPELEQRRRARREVHARSAAPVAAYVAARNALRERVPGIAPHRPWSTGDVGEVHYGGLRRVGEVEAVLLERNGEVLVLPVTDHQGAKLRALARGVALHVDDRGRFVERSRTRSSR